jgi:hypothetical protein
MRNESSIRAALLAAGLLALAPFARGEEDLRANLEAKLAKPFLKKVAWVRDYDAALVRARAEDKLVFAYFARSYFP